VIQRVDIHHNERGNKMSKLSKLALAVCLTMPSLVYAASEIKSRAADEPSAMAPAASIESRERPTDEKVFAEYIEYLVKVAEPRTAEQMKDDDYIKARYKDTMIVDSLFVGAPGFPAGFTAAMYEAGTDHSVDNNYNVISATITNAAPEDTPEVVLKRMKDTNAYWAKHSDKYLQVKTIADFQHAKKEGKLGMFHNFQGMQPLSPTGDEKEALQKVRRRYWGVSLSLPWPLGWLIFRSTGLGMLRLRAMWKLKSARPFTPESLLQPSPLPWTQSQ
jgi:hypothetical protein